MIEKTFMPCLTIYHQIPVPSYRNMVEKERKLWLLVFSLRPTMLSSLSKWNSISQAQFNLSFENVFNMDKPKSFKILLPFNELFRKWKTGDRIAQSH